MYIAVYILLQNRNLEIKTDQVPGHAKYIQPCIKSVNPLHIKIVGEQCRNAIRGYSVVFKPGVTLAGFQIGK